MTCDEFDVRSWPKELRYRYEERAGIKEFDGATPRDRAEREACEETWLERFEIGEN